MVLNIKNGEQKIIDGIIANDSKIVKSIYKKEYERIKNMVIGFGNIELLPEDVFQEGLTRAIVNVRNGKFNGKSTFSTYLYGICRNLCLKDYNRKTLKTGQAIQEVKEEDEENYFEELEMIIRLKNRLDEPCKKIIDLRFGIISTKEQSTRFEAIASYLNMSADNARQRFRRCFAKLKSIVLNNKEFKQIIS